MKPFSHVLCLGTYRRYNIRRVPSRTRQRRGCPDFFAYLLFEVSSSLPSLFNLLLRGCGLCTNVHSCLWNSHKTQTSAPSCMTHLLFLLRQASQGRSLLVRVFEGSADPCTAAPGEAIAGATLGFIKVSRVDVCGLSCRDCAAAIGMGVAREIEVCVAMMVVILLLAMLNCVVDS